VSNISPSFQMLPPTFLKTGQPEKRAGGEVEH